jgi:hypothetical protein
MDPLGLEPRASACFAMGTFAPIVAKAAIFQLIYEPSDVFGLPRLRTLATQRDTSVGFVAIEPFNCTGSFSASDRQCVQIKCLGVALGGDPAADSPTATLLRLNPTCKAQVRTCHKHALTQTLLAWFDGRCVQGAGTYSPRYVETRLLRIPAS